ncbi:hypothetical protein [Streptomyces sp. NPDC051561]|uniref:hypothetical protein n=1 Tax=Streptomyces sp. NPDC051561 TaxID=3365658 RepID=UPI0037BB039D
MRVRSSRSTGRPVALFLLASCLGATSACAGSDDHAQRPAERARQVAEAWDGSAAAAEWRGGYHPMEDVFQLPRGGLRNKADEHAWGGRSLIPSGKLNATLPKAGHVTWAASAKKTLTLSLQRVEDSLKALKGRNGGTGDRAADDPHLTVTGVKPGTMTLTTTRGPATVPAWHFTLAGYDTPLKYAAVLPSKPPRPPIDDASGELGVPLHHLSQITTDARSLTVIALHGACDDGAVVDVLETAGSVVLSPSVKERENEELCAKQGLIQSVTVKLTRPLGDRVLLDAVTGRPLPYEPGYGSA